jgi:hypothetical protein
MYIKVQWPRDEALIIGGGVEAEVVEVMVVVVVWRDPNAISFTTSAISCYKSHHVRDMEKNIGS